MENSTNENIVNEKLPKTIESTPKKKRNSSIELLRIILMFVIVMCHSSANIPMMDVNSTTNKMFLQLTNLSNLMVDIFVLISGYYICKLTFSLKKVIVLLLQVITYSVACYVFCVLVKSEVFSTKTFFLSFLPTITRKYWFVTAYVILYVLSPFINKLFSVLSEKEHLLLIATIGIIYSLIPTFTMFKQDGMDIFVLLLLYCIGAYLRLYPENKLLQNKMPVILTILGAILYFGSVIGLNIVGLKFKIFAKHPCYFLTKHSPITIIFAVGIFVLFSKFNFYNKYINMMGGATFGIYLLHNNGYFRQWLREDLFKFSSYSKSYKFIPYIIAGSVLIFIVCLIVEIVRKNTIEKITNKAIDKILPKKDK